MTTPLTPDRIPFTGDPEADALLAREPMALLIGFELDQQVTVQKAFMGPLELQRRIGTLDARRIAELDPGVLDEAFRRRPSLHRFPGSMAGKVRDLCAVIVRDYGGDPSAIWRDVADGRELERRLLALPGIGEMKAKSLVAILARRFGVEPPGWEQVLPDHPTLGDVDSLEALAAYQEGKRARKAAARAAS